MPTSQSYNDYTKMKLKIKEADINQSINALGFNGRPMPTSQSCNDYAKLKLSLQGFTIFK